MPVLQKIDHVHIYVPSQLEAEMWYEKVLGFERVKALESWFVDGGPLTIANGGVHIALFENSSLKSTTIALSADLINYQQWKAVLAENNVQYKESDHEFSLSIYFSDPYGNPYEITTYEHLKVCKKNE